MKTALNHKESVYCNDKDELDTREIEMDKKEADLMIQESRIYKKKADFNAYKKKCMLMINDINGYDSTLNQIDKIANIEKQCFDGWCLESDINERITSAKKE
jgi:hypothetical protein